VSIRPWAFGEVEGACTSPTWTNLVIQNRRPDPQFPVNMWGELGGAILTEANRIQVQKKGGTAGIVDGP